jgi:tetratricopeptide (TPR) repeat protein
MDLAPVFDLWEAGEPFRKRHLTRPDGASIDDLGQAYFTRLLTHYGSDPAKLNALGRHWRRVLPHADDNQWVYRAGGVFERAHGRWMPSAEAFLAAGDHATSPTQSYAFSIGAIDSLARAGKVDAARKLANKISRELINLGEPGLAARARLNLGNALVYQDRMPEARRVLSKAIPALDDAELALESASARLALSSTHLFGGEPRLAEQIAGIVADSALTLGADYLANLAGLNRALALTVTGRAEEAHRVLRELAGEFEDSPMDRWRVDEYMADALLRLNLWAEAEAAYRDVLQPGRALTPLHQANLELGLGQSLAAQGKTGPAQLHLRTAHRAYGRIGNRTWQGVCLHEMALLELEPAGEDVAVRRRALQRLLEAEALTADSPYHLTQIWLSLARFDPKNSDDDRLHQAERAIRRYGYLDLEWQVHYLRATQTKSSHKGNYFRKMFASIVAGRLGTRSVSARMGFLKDKTEALRAYLGWLLEKPTEKRVAEAMDAIVQIRSVTLLDEILRSGSLPPVVADRLSAARSALEGSVDTTLLGGTRRPRSSLSVNKAQRIATDALLELELATRPTIIGATDGVVVAETGQGINLIMGRRAMSLAVSEAELKRHLRWLSFEISAPMADRQADPSAANELLAHLASMFAEVWESDAKWICPDGLTWRIPWSLCSHFSDHARTWPIAMHPRMTDGYRGQLSPADRAVIWFGDSPDLPFAAREAEAIAAQFGDARIVTTQREARESLNDACGILHVVSHAVHRPNNPMLSSIHFPDGPIFAYEIAQSPLRLRLATLSACETGSISLATRSEPDGLARAFIARGAESVVASQWPLDDESGFIQFEAIYEALMSKCDLPAAIFRAQCICRAWRAHPYYWGALALYSGYGSQKN